MSAERTGGGSPVTFGESELSFYNRIQKGGSSAFNLLSPEEKTYFNILKQKVEYHGGTENALNKKAFKSKGVITSRSTKGNLTVGSQKNPIVVENITQAKDFSGSTNIVKTDRPGLYKTNNKTNTIYYFVKKIEKPIARTQSSSNTSLGIYGASGTSGYNSISSPQAGIVPTTGPTTGSDYQKSKTAKPPSEDTLFNSADYQSTYEEAIREITLSLIESADDLMSSYSYESIDSLPDIDIEIKIGGGEFVNAKEVFEKGLFPGIIEVALDGSDSAEEYEIANRMLIYIEKLIGSEATNGEKLKYFGSFQTDGVTFIKAIGRSGDAPILDFNMDLPNEYEMPTLNEVIIRFDPI